MPAGAVTKLRKRHPHLSPVAVKPKALQQWEQPRIRAAGMRGATAVGRKKGRPDQSVQNGLPLRHGLQTPYTVFCRPGQEPAALVFLLQRNKPRYSAGDAALTGEPGLCVFIGGRDGEHARHLLSPA